MRRPRHRIVPAVIAALLCLPYAVAAAELRVEGSAGCLDAQELGFRLERALGRPVSEVEPKRVAVRVARSEVGLSARIEVSDDNALTERMERVVSAIECGELADAVTVVIALALDSSVQATTSGAQGANELPETPAVAAGALGETAPADEASLMSAGETEQLAPTVSLWIVGDAGSLPSPGFGFALGVELGAEHWQLRALGTLLVAQRHQLGSAEETAAPGAELGLVTGALLGCLVPVGSAISSPLALRVCAGWELGQLSGVGTGVAEPKQGHVLWNAPLVDVGVLWAVPHTRLQLGALLVAAAPLERDEFVLRDLGHVHRPAGVVARAVLGAAFALD